MLSLIANEAVSYTHLALKLYYLMPAEYRDAFDQLVLFPIQACSNLYDMYYAVAMNRKLAEVNDVKANKWADKARACFERDSVLTYHYNHVMSGGKWNHIMDQTHIGYRSWNDPKRNIMPVSYTHLDVYKRQERDFNVCCRMEKPDIIRCPARQFIPLWSNRTELCIYVLKTRVSVHLLPKPDNMKRSRDYLRRRI